MFAPLIDDLLLSPDPIIRETRADQPDTEALRERGSELLPALVGLLCPASEVTLYAQFADATKVAVVAPRDWMQLGQYALIRRVHCDDGHLVPLRDESVSCWAG
jgi:hypothetical protein